MTDRQTNKTLKKNLKKMVDNLKKMNTLELVGFGTIILLIPGGSLLALVKLLKENKDDKS